MKREDPDGAPSLPKGVEPHTFAEMVDCVQARLSEVLVDQDETAVRGRAWAAVGLLIDQGYVQWWGLDPAGLPVYVPAVGRRTKQAIVYIW